MSLKMTYYGLSGVRFQHRLKNVFVLNCDHYTSFHLIHNFISTCHTHNFVSVNSTFVPMLRVIALPTLNKMLSYLMTSVALFVLKGLVTTEDLTGLAENGITEP